MNNKIEKISLSDKIIFGFITEESETKIKVCSTSGVEGFVDCVEVFKKDILDRHEIEDFNEFKG